jgi:hypothetical protein
LYIAESPSQFLFLLIPETNWSNSFFAAPIGLAMLVSVVLKVLRPKEFNLGTYIVAWSVSGPVGFLLWVFAWKMYGGGTGQITAGVGATAFLGWCALHRGWYVARIERRIFKGSAICLVSALTAMSVKNVIGNSTAPISLAMLTAFTGSALPLCVVISVKSMIFVRRFGNEFLRPTWIFLNRPVTLEFRLTGKRLDISPPT